MFETKLEDGKLIIIITETGVQPNLVASQVRDDFKDQINNIDDIVEKIMSTDLKDIDDETISFDVEMVEDIEVNEDQGEVVVDDEDDDDEDEDEDGFGASLKEIAALSI